MMFQLDCGGWIHPVRRTTRHRLDRHSPAIVRPSVLVLARYAYYGLQKCSNRTLSIRAPACCCGVNNEYKCTQCETLPVLVGRPALSMTRPQDWLDKPMCNGALVAFSDSNPKSVDLLCVRDHSARAPGC